MRFRLVGFLLLAVSVLLVSVLLVSCGQDKAPQSMANVPQPTQLDTSNPTGSGTSNPTGSGTSNPTRSGVVPQPTVVTATGSGDTLSLVGVIFDLPEGWIKEQPSSSVRLAQYRLPGNAGPALLTAFSFGKGMGGSTSANIERWVGQFSTPDGPPKPEINTQEQRGLKISVVEVSGTYSGTAMGPMAPAAPPQANQALYGLIAEDGPQGTLFIKITGPAATIQTLKPTLDQFGKSARLASNG